MPVISITKVADRPSSRKANSRPMGVAQGIATVRAAKGSRGSNVHIQTKMEAGTSASSQPVWRPRRRAAAGATTVAAKGASTAMTRKSIIPASGVDARG